MLLLTGQKICILQRFRANAGSSARILKANPIVANDWLNERQGLCSRYTELRNILQRMLGSESWEPAASIKYSKIGVWQ